MITTKGQPRSGQSKSGQSKSSQSKSGQSKSGQSRSDITVEEKQLAVLSRVLQQLRETTDRKALVQTILDYVQTEIDYSFVWLTLYDRLNHCLLGQGGIYPGNSKTFLNERLSLNSGDLVEQVVIQQRPLIVPDLRAESRAGKLAKIAQAAGIQGTLIFPIRYRDICYGIAILGSERWGIVTRPGEKAQLSIVLGQFASTLQHLEAQEQQTHLKRPEEPLFKLLNQLPGLANLSQRLELIVAESQRFIDASRVTLYWFEPDKRYFWRRCSSRQNTTASLGPSSSQSLGQSSGSSSPQAPADLWVTDCLKFYQLLSGNQLVSVGMAQSSLTPEATTCLLEKLRLRSILAAPIQFQHQFLGFLAAEGTKARVWTEEEKYYFQGAAQLVSLATPLDRIEAEIARNQSDHALIAQVSQAIRSEHEWNQVLKTTLAQLAKHFKVERVLLLAYEPEQGIFPIAFQHQEGRRKSLVEPLGTLSDVDWRLLEKVEEGVGIEDLEHDLRFLAWRSSLQAAGIASLLVCRTTLNPPIEGVLMLTQESPRTWSPPDQELLNTLAQHLGVLLHQWQLQKQVDQQQSLYQTLQWGLTTIQQTDDLRRLERVVTQSIAQILKVPLALLITWEPGRPIGQFTSLAISNPKFTLKADTQVPVQDVFIQQVLTMDGLLKLSVEQLTPDTRQWLGASGIEQVLAIALRTSPDDEPLGIMLVADQGDRFWPDRILSLYGILVNQLAWFRRSLLLIQSLQSSKLRLQQLTWYKHYRLLDLKRVMDTTFNQLSNLIDHQGTATGTNSIHYQQAMRQLGQILSSWLQLLRQEQWQLRAYQTTSSLASLLKRSLERIDPFVKQNQLWVQVHADDTKLELTGDMIKLEGILYQVLLFACQRALEQGRIDLWCRVLDEQTLDLSITDYGQIEPRLLAELQQGRPTDMLAPSALDQLSGLALFLCQTLLTDMGGSLEFYQLEDGRIMSRLVLPFISGRR